MATSADDRVPHIVEEFCSTCKNKDRTEVCAEKYCETCARFYYEKCVGIHDQLFAGHVLYGKRDINELPVSKTTEDVDAFIRTCDLHKYEKLDRFCNNHGQLCCSQCNHSAGSGSEDVGKDVEPEQGPTACAKSDSKIRNDIQSTYTDIMKELENEREHRWEAEVAAKKLVDGIKTLTTKAKEDGQMVRDEREVKLRLQEENEQLETQLQEAVEALSQSKSVQEEQTRTIRELEDMANKEEREKMKQQTHEIGKLQEALMRGDALSREVDLVCSTCEAQKQQIQSLQSLLANREQEHRYCLDVTLVSGSAKQQSTMAVLGNPDQVFTVKGKSEYDVSIPSDSSACLITGICVLPDGQILVVDYSNNKLKLLDHQYRVLTHCDVSTYPRDICHITLSKVAVTVNDANTHRGIQFISVNNGQLVKGRKLQLRHYCEGIAHHQGELYVTDQTALYKYTLSGKLVSKLYEGTSRGETVWRCAVSPTGDLIYITNHSQHKLLTLARDGSVLSTLEDPELPYPRAVHVTPAGQVLVCGGGSQTIIQVDREGRKKLATLATRRDGVGDPYSVCYNRHTASIIVGQWNNNIVVLKVE